MRAERERFAGADEARFIWATEHPAIKGKERELVAPLLTFSAKRVLEVGCGNGSNLANLRAMGLDAEFFGVDASPARAAYCRRHVPGGTYAVCADGGRLPFADKFFDAVLVRDVFHHVEDKVNLYKEILRVAGPGGRIIVVEPNTRKLTVRAWARLATFDHGILTTSRELLTEIFSSDRRADIIESSIVEPANFARVIFHHRLGLSWLGHFPPARWLVWLLEQLNVLLTCGDKGAYLRFVMKVGE